MKFNPTEAQRLRELSFRLINNNPWMAFWISCDGWKVVEVKDHPPKKKGRPWKKKHLQPLEKRESSHLYSLCFCVLSPSSTGLSTTVTVRFRWQALVKKNWQTKYPATLKQHETKNTIRKNSTSPKHHNQVVWSEDSEHLSILLKFKVLNLVEYLCTHRWAKTNCQISAFNVATMTLVRLLKRVSSWESIKLVAKLSVHQHAPELFVE